MTYAEICHVYRCFNNYQAGWQDTMAVPEVEPAPLGFRESFFEGIFASIIQEHLRDHYYDFYDYLLRYQQLLDY
ncbi:MAG: hypothetical protein FWF06_01020, partial [Symbiobacteriaceae bacterium]|nr:hypothetical protein [Symbiobacteriaceae bacterium]